MRRAAHQRSFLIGRNILHLALFVLFHSVNNSWLILEHLKIQFQKGFVIDMWNIFETHEIGKLKNRRIVEV